MAGRAGRADLSTNWRVKSDLPASSPTGPNRGWGQTQENYMAKREDVEELFKDLESAMQVQLHLIRAHAND